jgi:hypothetical protein
VLGSQRDLAKALTKRGHWGYSTFGPISLVASYKLIWRGTKNQNEKLVKHLDSNKKKAAYL